MKNLKEAERRLGGLYIAGYRYSYVFAVVIVAIMSLDFTFSDVRLRSRPGLDS